jgi:NAD+ kinase
MPKSLQLIHIFACKDSHDVIETLRSLHQMLKDYTVCWESNTALLAKLSDTTLVEYPDLGKGADLIIVVGGDGSILRCARAAMQHNTPLIGINKGRLGFLTDIRSNELATRLLAVLKGEYWSAERFLLDSYIVYPDNRTLSGGCALNDIILYPGCAPRMHDFEIYVDNQFMCSHRADGIIIATPTGSTAYNLSAGGPIVQPNVDALVILPMFSHSLTNCPIVVPGNSQIRIEFSETNSEPSKMSSTIGEPLDVTPGSKIFIQKAEKTITLIHPQDYTYYETLRRKLQWGQRLTN